MDSLKLWEERDRGGGDVIVEVNGASTTAHWTVLGECPFFRCHMEMQERASNNNPNLLKIRDTTLSLEAVVCAMRFIYLDFCFTQSSDLRDFTYFCWKMRSPSLETSSLDIVMENITQSSCVDCYRLGYVFNILPLQWRAWKQAIENNWVQQLKEMTTPNIDINSSLNTLSQTALHISVANNQVAMTEVLIERGANVDKHDSQGQTPLMMAAWSGNRHIVVLLLHMGADVDRDDQYQQTALHKACGRGSNEVVKLLLDFGANSELMSLDGHTPLHIAASGAHRDVVITLLGHGVTWQLGDNQWQLTALHMAAMKGDADLVKLLVQLYDTEQVRNEVARECLTPLHTAVQSGYCEVIKILLSHGALVRSCDWEGRTPLHYAAKSGNVEAMDILLKSGAELYSQDKYKMTCLHLAAARNHTNAVAMLLKYQSCPLNVVDRDGLTALHYAAENRNTNMVRQLLRAGSVPTILSEDGHVARNLVGKKKHLDTLKFLILARS